MTNKKRLLKNHVCFRLLILILLLAFLLRSKTYLQGDFNYTLDQARDLLLAKEIVVNRKLTLIGGRAGFGGLFHGPLWIYMIIPFFIVNRGDPFWTLVPLFILSDLAIIGIGYFLIGNLFGKKAGLIFSFLLAVSRPLINFSHNFSNANWMPLIFLLYLFSSIKLLRGEDKYFILCLFLIGLGFHFQSAFAIFLFPLTLTLIIIKHKLPSLRVFFLGIIAFFFSISNFILFEVRHNFLMTYAAWKLISGKTPPMRDYELFANIVFRILNRLNGLKEYVFLPTFETNLFIKILIVGVVIINIVWLLKLKNKKEFVFILAIPFLYYLLYIIYPYPLWPHYTASLVVSSALLVTIFLIKILDSKWSLMGFALLILLLFFSFRWILINYRPDSLKKNLGSYRDQLEVAKFIFNDAKKKQFGYLVYDPGGLTYHMDYLMWWLANEKYRVSLINDKQPLTYLIMYKPPIWAKGARHYWKEKVVRTKGKVIDKKIFPNEILVEKLQVNLDEPPVDPNYFQNLIFR